jgi:predicted nucleic acid-binding protein
VKTPRLVLTDANVLINFAQVDRLDLLGALPDLDFRAPGEVLAEVIRERARVEDALRRGDLRELLLEETRELALFVDLRQIMGMGEAACLAMAVHRGALIASDEKRVFKRETEARLGPGRLLNTPGLLLLAIRRGLLTVDEADDLKRDLEARRFRMTFGSFRELISK